MQTVHLKSVRGVLLSLDVPVNSTVDDLKGYISQKIDCPKESIKIMHKSSLLSSSTEISIYPTTIAAPLTYYSPKNTVSQNENKVSAPVPEPPQPVKPEPKVQEEARNQFINPEPIREAYHQPVYQSNYVNKEYSSQIAVLTEMGFKEEECHFALEYARGDCELAAELLSEGITSHEKMEEQNMKNTNVQMTNLIKTIIRQPETLQNVIECDGVFELISNGRIMRVSIDVDTLREEARKAGIPIPQKQQQDISQMETIYQDLSMEERHFLYEICQTYQIEMAEVLQYYMACDKKQKDTIDLIKTMI